MRADTIKRKPFWKQFLLLFGIGFFGVVALAPVSAEAIAKELSRLPEAPQIPLPLLAVISLIQPTILLAIAVVIGIPLSARLELCSYLTLKTNNEQLFRQRILSDLKLAVVLGLVTSALAIVLDLSTQAWIPELKALEQGMPGTPIYTIAGILYGGITEELIMRWGVMSLIAWIIWRLFQKGKGKPQAIVMWSAIFLSAILFGLGHLPITAALITLTPIIVARALILNGIAAVVFGWLYWKRSIETAMMAHSSFHIFASIILGIISFFV